jgi:signal peptidase II
MLKKNLIIFFSVATIFLIDRVSKILVISKSEKLNQNEIFSTKFINFHLIWNEGIAFGLFSFSNSSTYQIMTLFILLVILILIFYMLKTDMINEKIGFILIVGGAIGNLFDRFFYSAVPDFIDLHINNFHWFIFNIADIFITTGVLWLILTEIIFKKKHATD